jgi:hypothetical protein
MEMSTTFIVFAGITSQIVLKPERFQLQTLMGEETPKGYTTD